MTNFNKTLNFLKTTKGLFFVSKTPITTALEKKVLLLDNINPVYSEHLIKEFGLDLGTYLSKYLAFWLKNTKKDMYFLQPEFIEDDFDCILPPDSYYDFKNFGGVINNEELFEMNELPSLRKEIAKITIFGESIYFKKLNHFYNILEFFSTCHFNPDFPLRGFIVIGNSENLYNFPKLSSTELQYHSYGRYSRNDVGFFHINFRETFITEDFINNGSTILEDFLYFLKTSDLTFNFNSEQMLDFYKILLLIKSQLLENKYNNKESPCPIPLLELIVYIDSFLTIVKKSLFKTDRFYCFIDNFKRSRYLLKIIIKNIFYPKINFLLKNKILILPIFSCFSLFIYLRLLFPQFFFIVFSSIILIYFYFSKPNRNFPTYKAKIFDFQNNFKSRLSFSTFLKVFCLIRLFLSLFIMLNSYLELLIINAIKSDTLNFISNLTDKEIQLVVQTLTLAMRDLGNPKIKVIFEELLRIKLTSVKGSLQHKETMALSYLHTKKDYDSFLNNSPLVRHEKALKMENNLSEALPHIKDSSEAARLSIAINPENFSQKGYPIFSTGLSSELFFSNILAYSNLGSSKFLPKVVFQWDQAKLAYQYLQGDFIIENVYGDIKSLAVSKLVPGNWFILKNERILKPIRNILEINDKNEYILVLDSTHIILTQDLENKINQAFQEVIRKNKLFRDNDNRPRLYLEFLKRIPGITEQVCSTDFIEFVLQNKKILSILDKYNLLVEECKEKVSNKDLTLVSIELHKKMKEIHFDPHEQISKIISEEYSKDVVLKKPMILSTKDLFIKRKTFPKESAIKAKEVCLAINEGQKNLAEDLKQKSTKNNQTKNNYHWGIERSDGTIMTKGSYELQQKKWSGKGRTKPNWEVTNKEKVEDLCEKTPYSKKVRK